MTTPPQVAHGLAHGFAQDGQEWVARIRAGDERAFEALFRALAPGLCALAARYVGSREAAEELVQELFLDLWTRRAELAVGTSLTAYLHVAARNRALNRAKRERRIVRFDSPTGDAPDTADHAMPGETELLDLLDVQDAVERLPPRCRLIFTLARQQEMTYGEIARSLGLSVKTVETQMGRALKSLRERLRGMVG